MLENPPDEKSAAVSGLMPVAAPTDVKKGQPEGKDVIKVAQVDGWSGNRVPHASASPDEKRIEVPRAPSRMNALQSCL